MTHSRQQFGRFYTPPEVASALIGMVDATPRTILDLGCGEGALSLAAVARWSKALSLTTLDVDPVAGPRGIIWSSDHQHHHCDLLRTYPLASVIGRKRFDLAILNPPYGRHPSDNEWQAWADRVDLPWKSIRCRSTLFVMYALEAVRLGGMVAAILPETLAIGRASKANRSTISGLSAVERIATLPAKTFNGTEARTVMVVFRRLPERDGCSAPWCYTGPAVHVAEDCGRAPSTIGDLGVTVVRGRLNTIEARNAGAFHLDAFKSALDGLVSFPKHDSHHDDRTAQEGDILVARVGRNISDKIVRVATGSNAISDCVYRLRCPPSVADRVWHGLRSPAGKRQMDASLSGVTTRLLPLHNLLTLQV